MIMSKEFMRAFAKFAICVLIGAGLALIAVILLLLALFGIL